MFQVTLCFTTLALFFVRGLANPVLRPECRAGVCDDRPVCPKSPCRCIYPSKVDCGLYYQCVQGKPYQYRCSPGLLFNEKTLTCDYDYNINCSIGKTTRNRESSTAVTTLEVKETVTVVGNNVTSNDSSTFIELSTKASFNDSSKEYSKEVHLTTTSDKTYSQTTGLEFIFQTANTTDSQNESYSKSIVADDATTLDLFVNPTNTSEFQTDSSPDILISTTSSRSSYFVTEITGLPSTSKRIEEPEIDKENKEGELTSPPFTSKENDESEATISTAKVSSESEATISTVKVSSESEATISTAKVSSESEATISTAKVSNESEATISTVKVSNEPEMTNLTFTTKDTKEFETTSFESTITGTSKPNTTNGSSEATELLMTTEEIQPEITTDVQNHNWTCPSRFGLFSDESNCNKFYHCSHWKPYHKKCPSNLHFNSVLQVCDWPEHAGCDSLTTSTSIRYSDTTNDKVSETSPFEKFTTDSIEQNNVTDKSNKSETTMSNSEETTTSYGETSTTSEKETTSSNGESTTPNGETTTTSNGETTTTSNGETTTSNEERTTSNVETTTFNEETTTTNEETTTTNEETTTAEKGATSTKRKTTTSNGETTTSDGETATMSHRETTTTSDGKIIITAARETTSNGETTTMSGRETTTTSGRETTTTSGRETTTSNVATAQTTSDRDITSTADRDIIITADRETATETDRETSTMSERETTATADRDIIITGGKVTTITADRQTTSNGGTTTSNRGTATTADRETTSNLEKTTTTDRETTMSNVETAATTSDREITTTADRDVIITADRQTTSKGETTTSNGEISTTADVETTTPNGQTSIIYRETTTSKGGTETSNGESTTSPNVKTISDVETTTSNEETTTSNVETTTSNVETTTSNVETTTSNVETSSNGEPTTNVETTVSNAEPTTKVEITTANKVTTTSITEVTASKETTALNRSTTITENSSNEFTETYKDENTHSIVPEIATTRITSSNDSMKFECPNRFGLYPDPESCSKFYHCSHWVGYHKTCPSDLHFNPVLQVCDWPYRAGCGISPVVPTSEPILPKEDDIISNQTCDCECCFYANKTDCSKYTLCLDGVLHMGQCAEGLLFNHVDHNCDIADRVTCLQTSAFCPTPNGVFPHPVLCSAFYRCFNGQPTLESCPVDKHFKASEGKCVDPCDANCNKTLSCSTPSPPSEVSTSPICIENDGLYPSENDCSSYYQCAEGQPYFVKCPDGLHFNVEYGVCERPCDAQCDPTIDCPWPIQLAMSKSLDIVGSQCPRPSGLFPAVQDCSAYYLCFKGKSYLQHCPPGLHYSTEHETCETPCNAQCVKNIDCSVLKGVRSKENLLKQSFFLPLWLICKTFNNEKLANPTNCTSFYKCSDGKPHLLPCPRGLHFDPEDRECKDPCLAGCDSSIKCPSEIPVHKGKCSCENCYLQDPTDCSAYLFCSQGLLTKGYCPRGTLFDRSSGECRNSSEVVCEAVGDPGMCREKSGNFPYPGDCHRFVRCEDSVAHIVDCEDGLEFDPEIRACANPKGYCDQIVKDPLCEGTAGQFSHPSNRSLFYHCENGVKYLKECSPPLVYNALDQVCDWPHNTQDKSVKEVLKKQDKNQNNMTSSSGHAGAQQCHEVPGVTCPCACRVTTYDDCDSFYHCRGDGKACLRRCPQGLYFNRQTMVCDLPQNVECRDFFFATLKRLKYRESKRTWLKYPLQSVQSSPEFKF